MKSGYQIVDAGGLKVAITTAQTIPGLNAAFTKAFACGKSVLLCNFRFNAATPSTPAFVTVRPATGSAGTMRAQLDNYLIEVTTADRATCSDLIPDEPVTITATTDQLFAQAYLDGLADGATVRVIPAAHSQGRTFSLNLGAKSVYMDFSAYTTASVNCTGFVSQGNKVWKVSGSISPWIQTETLTTITISED